MALRKLTDAECGGPNALVHLTSHFTRDRAFAETHGHAFPASSDQLVEQFLAETRAAPQTFRMDDLMREMHEIESQRAAIPPIPASAVKEHLNDDAWALQYLEDSRQFNQHPDHERIWNEVAQEEPQIFEMTPNWTEEYFQEHLENVETQQNASELAEKMGNDPRFEYSKVGNGEMNLQEPQLQDEAAAWSQEFLGQSAKEDPDGLAQSWAEEHTKTNEDAFNNKFWNNLQEEWKKLADTETEHTWANEFNDEYYDPYKEYKFSDENPLADIENPLERGKEMLEKGDLPSAVLCFEAAVKKEPENGEAWLLLGTTQAENEQDPKAIAALKQCLAVDPTNLPALMSLAVSYTNESYYNQACQSLVTWLKENPKYRDLVAPDFSISGQVTSLLNPNHHKIVQDLYIKAAQRNPTNVDYEVQCGLGVLFNLSGEYEKAADCFKAALNVKPDDARLWNRLGATLANGSMPEQAVDAYHRALALVPGFIRARYNVGITCINLSAYKEAAEHFLIALNQQARGKDVTNSGEKTQMSETIWSTLRMCVALMNRLDLKPLVDQRNLKALSDILEIHD
ncbi:peroxisomal targeting signal 1 receptor isoform X2 [Onthophagus taurus]|uniref:peroxisomal targeting signal 1 receptor isoform X2 n=1 Tax=Onthophagus taurus TaxID=166361 RepID=UPI0039BEAF6E